MRGRGPERGLPKFLTVVAGTGGVLFILVLWTATSQGGPGGRTWGWRHEGGCDGERIRPGGICAVDDTARVPPASLIQLAADSLVQDSLPDANAGSPRG